MMYEKKKIVKEQCKKKVKLKIKLLAKSKISMRIKKNLRNEDILYELGKPENSLTVTDTKLLLQQAMNHHQEALRSDDKCH